MIVDPISLIVSSISGAWPFLLLAVFILFLRTPFVKGKIGEGIVNTINTASLDKATYIPVKNVTLKLSNNITTQIDHILVSKYGIFVIETKNMKGWIFGGEHQKEWTQQNFKQKHKFQNPIHQNYRHINALKEVLDLPLSKFFSIVVFVGDNEFKTSMPYNVFRGMSYVEYIRSFKEEELTQEQVNSVISTLNGAKLPAGFKTDREHVANLRARHDKKVENICPKCGNILMLRKGKAERGDFFGCSGYPKCRFTKPAQDGLG